MMDASSWLLVLAFAPLLLGILWAFVLRLFFPRR